jgi:hypothetical protein
MYAVDYLNPYTPHSLSEGLILTHHNTPPSLVALASLISNTHPYFNTYTTVQTLLMSEEELGILPPGEGACSGGDGNGNGNGNGPGLFVGTSGKQPNFLQKLYE